MRTPLPARDSGPLSPWEKAFWSPPPLRGRVRVGGPTDDPASAEGSHPQIGPPTPALPRKGGGSQIDARERGVRTRTRRPRRRGVTLVEMLVVVALLVLMMTIIVSIFQSATGAINAQRTFAELDQNLRRLDATLRSDLQGVTAYFNVPMDPA